MTRIGWTRALAWRIAAHVLSFAAGFAAFGALGAWLRGCQ